MKSRLIFIIAAAYVAGGWVNASAQSPELKKILKAESTSVVLLGTGMPRPDPKASGPATAVVVGSRVFVVDAGPGVERQLRAANLPIDGPTALFLTHLHSDHTLGYPDLIFTSWVMGRKKPMQVYGPSGLRRMTDHLMEAYAEDIRARIDGLEHLPAEGHKVDAHEIREGEVYNNHGVRVTAIPVKHGCWRNAYAYRFDTPDRSIVISGDTRPCESLAQAAKGADVLVHEVYPESEVPTGSSQDDRDWVRYLREFHTSDVELGLMLASRNQPKLLVLSHIVRKKATDEDLIRGVRKGGFRGRVVVGHDLEKY